MMWGRAPLVPCPPAAQLGSVLQNLAAEDAAAGSATAALCALPPYSPAMAAAGGGFAPPGVGAVPLAEADAAALVVTRPAAAPQGGLTVLLLGDALLQDDGVLEALQALLLRPAALGALSREMAEAAGLAPLKGAPWWRGPNLKGF
jgi:hypothetical protein